MTLVVPPIVSTEFPPCVTTPVTPPVPATISKLPKPVVMALFTVTAPAAFIERVPPLVTIEPSRVTAPVEPAPVPAALKTTFKALVLAFIVTPELTTMFPTALTVSVVAAGSVGFSQSAKVTVPVSAAVPIVFNV